MLRVSARLGMGAINRNVFVWLEQTTIDHHTDTDDLSEACVERSVCRGRDGESASTVKVAPTGHQVDSSQIGAWWSLTKFVL